MKNFICILFILTFCSNKNAVIIEDLNKVYKKDKNLEFSIVNTSREDKSYYISIDYKDDDEWREIVYTIYDPSSKSSLSKIIKSKQKIKIRIAINKIFYKNQFNYRSYRLKVFYGKKNLDEVYYSDSFKII